jgi:ATP-dependent DNA helicase RecG
LQDNFFDTKLEYLKGMGTQKANLLGLELQLFTFADLLTHYPFRHEDRTKFYDIGEITEDYPYVQLKGKITDFQLVGSGEKKKRLTAKLQDDTGIVELVWFQGIQWVQPKLKKGYEYIVFGKPQLFGRMFNIAHPEIELFLEHKTPETALSPVYSTTTKLQKRYLDSKGIGILVKNLLEIGFDKIPETLSNELIEKYKFIPKNEAIKQIHFPQNPKKLHQAVRRLKFEEFFFIQLKLLWQKTIRKHTHQGQILKSTALLTAFYNNHLPFDLTNAQKRVIKEIYKDLCNGKQMNRLLQGDVGSGKTMVAFICMLIAIANDTQACLMAPTEILADQHYKGLKEYADKMHITIAKLTGSSKTSERKIIHQMLKDGDLKIIIGTHALIEEDVIFHNLGLCVIDEQHRFGVAQRAALWKKNESKELPPPHVLVMTATPIPRTLAMTLYGDLDVSTIDELPAGRKPIQTMHFYDANRLKVFGFLKKQIELGRQVYIVYPLIEESEVMDYKNLMDGFESISRAFPEYPVSIVHGQMKAQDKDFEMQRFVKNETKIMVATTVIEVGVNVPNASVMVIEDAQRFGLSQLHQLRGRVGRGVEQSFCLLMTNHKLSKEGKIRIETMVRTNNGFEIADIDLKLRGPGNLDGTQQSGVLDLRLGDIAKDQIILQEARKTAEEILDKDSRLELPENVFIKRHLASVQQGGKVWSRIS